MNVRPGSPTNGNVFVGKHMTNRHRLIDNKTGAIVRVQEKHILIYMELLHRFCKPGLKVFDGCAGSGAILNAMILLGIPGVISDIDEGCMKLAEARSRVFLDAQVKKGSYPSLCGPIRRFLTYDQADPYACLRGNTTDHESIFWINRITRPYAFPILKEGERCGVSPDEVKTGVSVSDYDAHLRTLGIHLHSQQQYDSDTGDGSQVTIPSFVLITFDVRKGGEIPWTIFGEYIKTLHKNQELKTLVFEVDLSFSFHPFIRPPFISLRLLRTRM